jgi:hypothetical protein
MRLTLRSPLDMAAISGGKTRNHGCAQAFSRNDAMDDALKRAPGAFIADQTVKRTQKGLACVPFALF